MINSHNQYYGADDIEREIFRRFMESKSKTWLRYSQDPTEIHRLNLRYINHIGRLLELNDNGVNNFVIETFQNIHPNRSKDNRIHSDSYFSGRITIIDHSNNRHQFTSLNSHTYESYFGFIAVENKDFKKELRGNIKRHFNGTDFSQIGFSQIEEAIRINTPTNRSIVVGNIGGFQLDTNIVTLLEHNGILGKKIVENFFEIVRRGDHDIFHELALPYYLNHFKALFEDDLTAYLYAETQTIIDHFRIIQKAFTKNPKLKFQLLTKVKEFFSLVSNLRFFTYPPESSIVGNKVKHLQTMYLFFLGRMIDFNDPMLSEIVTNLDDDIFQLMHDNTEYSIKDKNKDYVILSNFLDINKIEFIPEYTYKIKS